MDFIFMLTRQDQTVEDCLEVFEEIRPLGLGHVGFKDVGVDRATLKALNRAIRDSGAVSYMEVVSESPEAALNSARTAAEIGVERLLGGTDVAGVMRLLNGKAGAGGLGYYPFPGKPVGHPTKLGGTPELVEAQCRRFLELGCAGVDLLAYRATEADPLDLVRAARAGLDGRGRLICAGSVDSGQRIRALKEAGCDAFTIGSAAFDGSFSPRKGTLRGRLRDILAAC
ncbi:hypothetical protein SAMN06265365_10311 [Tistlia consotensis]|uniref:1-(5-phosphoribosyl)-5-[(5-phosphoribosylamino)methylideneamino] imidazole-4-carboxamide isomerase n=1 Tax=Tistlia consotensis USBA 355 TaxID=560819 RepID=A0A1Y6BMZ8_9PROT|nr:hypothetical protein [Tistlia consotensis]SMF19209.1 1-(5-phosphoribosyl)-5-[(5-phosphoribosylamino)methylideneamino] imidazole-4-carboxamide isomerase [Tistlia consotensis USBA 355]SNR39116.1 hypothetical protein SAMN06265365_10311 [Tistlia consotensis]